MWYSTKNMQRVKICIKVMPCRAVPCRAVPCRAEWLVSLQLFYLVTESYTQGNLKEMRKWAYEIHSTFLVERAVSHPLPRFTPHLSPPMPPPLLPLPAPPQTLALAQPPTPDPDPHPRGLDHYHDANHVAIKRNNEMNNRDYSQSIVKASLILTVIVTWVTGDQRTIWRCT